MEKSLNNEYEARYPVELNKVEDETRLLKAEIDKLKKTIESRLLEVNDEIKLRIRNLEEEINEREKIKFSLLSLFSFLRAKINLRNKKKLLQDLNINTQKEHDRLLEKENFDLKTATNRCTYLKNNKIDEANKRMKSLHYKFENIARIKTSSEYSGAIGELEVIKNLKNLPDDYFLLNVVSLELSDYIRFDNSYLKSAQIDHLVIGLTGVYVIETKNWSAEFVQQKFNEGDFNLKSWLKLNEFLCPVKSARDKVCLN